jgi:hypothetical protein
MKQILSLTVEPGQVLRLHSSSGLQSEPATVPAGVSSVTIIIRDSESYAAMLERQQKRREGGPSADRIGSGSVGGGSGRGAGVGGGGRVRDAGGLRGGKAGGRGGAGGKRREEEEDLD